jgi:hypothetical protein
MLLPLPQLRRRRLHVPVANRILKVSHTGVVNRLNVIISGPLVDLDFTQAIQAFDGTTWHSSTGGSFDSLPLVAISFGSVHVNTAAQWRIVDPGVWMFEDGRVLMPPYSGAIG